MPLGDFTSSGLPSSSFNGTVFPYVNSGVTRSKRGMNDDSSAGKFEVSNQAPNQKKPRLGMLEGLEEAHWPMFDDFELSSCPPPTCGYYGYTPPFQSNQATERKTSLSQDAPLSCAVSNSELMSVNGHMSLPLDEDMDTVETSDALDKSPLAENSASNLVTIDDPRTLERQSNERLLRPIPFYTVFH